MKLPEGVDRERQYVRLVPVEVVKLLQSDVPGVADEVRRVVEYECRRGCVRVGRDEFVVVPKYGQRSVLLTGSF